MEQNNLDLAQEGSIQDTASRLALWACRASSGYARVEFHSEHSRRQVVQALQLALADTGIPVNQIDLPPRRPAGEQVKALLARLDGTTPGVVSITGWNTAFPDNEPLEDALREVRCPGMLYSNR